MLQIALIAGAEDNEAKPVELEWPALAKALSDHRITNCHPCLGHDCSEKNGRAWIPARFSSPRRIDLSVEAITVAVFDLDAPTTDQLAALGKAIDGLTYLAHETHAPGSYRLVIPLAVEVPVAQWPQVWQAMVDRFCPSADTTCKNPSRHYYFASKPAGTEPKHFSADGEVFDWRTLDLLFPNGPAGIARAFQASVASDLKGTLSPQDPKNLREGPLDLEEMRRTVKSLRRPESRAMLDTILAGRRLTESFPADIGFRDAAVLQATALLATAPQGKPYPVESVIALLYGSIQAMDLQPEGLDHWLDVAREKYIRKVGERLERDARADADKAALFSVFDSAQAKGAKDLNWRSELLWLEEGKGLKQLGANASTILEHDEHFKGTIRFNALSRAVEVTSGPLERAPVGCLETELKNWFARSEYRLNLSTFEVGEQLLAQARKQEYNPVREWLETLQWDGTERVENFFRKVLNADGPEEHLRAISRCFLISCVARAFEPGCEVHTAPILVGRQGVGKSRALRALGSPFFSDSKINFADKDSQLMIAGVWIVELAELSGWRAVDTETIKAFVSRPEDRMRVPYGKHVEAFPRRCVFVGTTNEEEMLSDPTGNRRWWPVRVGRIDVDKVAKVRDSLFAEAVVLYRSGVQWHLTAEESAAARDHAEQFTAERSARQQQLMSWFEARPPRERPAELTTFDVLSIVFALPSAQCSKTMQMEAARVLREMGFHKHHVRRGGQMVWAYTTPAEIMTLPFNGRAGLQAVE